MATEEKGSYVLLANGFTVSGQTDDTPGLADWMRQKEIKTVALINWATCGCPPEKSQTNEQALRKMESCGFKVLVISTNSTPADMEERFRCVEAIYLNGGNPGILLYMLKKTGCDKLLRDFHDRGGHLLLASSGGIVLGSGNIFTTCCFAVKPNFDFSPFWLRSYGIAMKGLGFFPEGFIPHNSESNFPKIIRWAVRVLMIRVKTLTFVPDGTMKVIEPK